MNCSIVRAYTDKNDVSLGYGVVLYNDNFLGTQDHTVTKEELESYTRKYECDFLVDDGFLKCSVVPRVAVEYFSPSTIYKEKEQFSLYSFIAEALENNYLFVNGDRYSPFTKLDIRLSTMSITIDGVPIVSFAGGRLMVHPFCFAVEKDRLAGRGEYLFDVSVYGADYSIYRINSLPVYVETPIYSCMINYAVGTFTYNKVFVEEAYKILHRKGISYDAIPSGDLGGGQFTSFQCSYYSDVSVAECIWGGTIPTGLLDRRLYRDLSIEPDERFLVKMHTAIQTRVKWKVLASMFLYRLSAFSFLTGCVLPDFCKGSTEACYTRITGGISYGFWSKNIT